MNEFKLIFKREIWLNIANKEFFNQILMVVMCILLFPLAIADDKLLKAVAPAVFCIIILLTTVLSFESFFKRDIANNMLPQMLTSNRSFLIMLYAKLIAHFITTTIPLIIMLPIISSWLFLDNLALLFITTITIMPILILIGALGTSLTIKSNYGNFLQMLIILPFYIPTLILSSNMLILADDGFDYSANLYFILAILCFCVCFIPIAIEYIIRLSYK